MYLDSIDQLHAQTASMKTRYKPKGHDKKCDPNIAHSIDQLVEGETRLYGVSAEGVIFETDYITPDQSERAFTVLWKNHDASGYLKSHKGDQIVGIRY